MWMMWPPCQVWGPRIHLVDHSPGQCTVLFGSFCLIMWVTWLQFPLSWIGVFAFPSFQKKWQQNSQLYTRQDLSRIQARSTFEAKNLFQWVPQRARPSFSWLLTILCKHAHSFQRTCPREEAESWVHPFFFSANDFTDSERSHDKIDEERWVGTTIGVIGWHTFPGEKGFSVVWKEVQKGVASAGPSASDESQACHLISGFFQLDNWLDHTQAQTPPRDQPRRTGSTRKRKRIFS